MPKVSVTRADTAPGDVPDRADHTEDAAVMIRKLSSREREVADLVAQGLRDREISSRLVISRRTAESHVAHILTKLGFSSRVQLAAYVARLS
jgi:DNA-binding NarL/FixJ family response regulator